jgi:hypothetical protein
MEFCYFRARSVSEGFLQTGGACDNLPTWRRVCIVGEPIDTGYFRDWDLVYYLGDERGFISIDSEWLLFKLDDQKKVVNCRLATD